MHSEDMTIFGSFTEMFLCRLDEDMEYSDLLDQAVATSDPVQRMSYIAAFTVSGFASTKMRSGRKAL
jgi:hypothetical protein